MLNFLKDSYCFYLTQLAFNCTNENELNTKIDEVIDSNEEDTFVQGDEDISNVIRYVFKCRKYLRDSKLGKPNIDSRTIFRAMYKSVF